MRNKRSEEEQMELEMMGIMSGSNGLPPSAMGQQANVYGLQPAIQQPAQPYPTAQQFALQPVPGQSIYQSQYQLPPAQLQDQNSTQEYIQPPQQMDSYYQQ
jgi:hypothetical protein